MQSTQPTAHTPDAIALGSGKAYLSDKIRTSYIQARHPNRRSKAKNNCDNNERRDKINRKQMRKTKKCGEEEIVMEQLKKDE
jgi:hypothetical protein